MSVDLVRAGTATTRPELENVTGLGRTVVNDRVREGLELGVFAEIDAAPSGQRRGRPSRAIRFRAEAPGEYRGQCAEFCGLQHAHMALLILAEPPERFEAWREAQLKPASPPEDEQRRRGLQVLQTGPCVMCHTVRGTQAGGKVAPELTHLASRKTLAAGTLPLTRGTLAAWITDPQSIKPGANMPTIKLPTEDFQALVAYLEG